MAESPRIEELKRRVQVDPASIAFAALAEEYRRAGRFEEAIATCQAGLQRHPAYLSAHVTLGRALQELGRFDEARQELEHVLRAAPENLAAIRGLAEIHHRRGELPEALEQYRSALSVAKHDAELEDTVDQISRQMSPAEAGVPPGPAPLAGGPVDGATGPHSEPATARSPEPPPRPHLELVTRQPARAPDAAPEPPDAPVAIPTPADIAHEAAAEAAPAVVESAPVGRAEADDVAEAETGREPEADPALAALEGLLGAILREKDDLTARSAGR
jgi:tetratricopeptide (TPR) repeat protein